MSSWYIKPSNKQALKFFMILILGMIIFFYQSLRTEIDNHEQRIHSVCNNGQKLIDEGHVDALEFSERIEDLLDRWQALKEAVDVRRNKLLASERAQQYLFDANEAEAWMSEQVFLVYEFHSR